VVCSETSEKVKVFDMIAVGCDVVTREREREREVFVVCVVKESGLQGGCTVCTVVVVISGNGRRRRYMWFNIL
jgi:hypothetical protein